MKVRTIIGIAVGAVCLTSTALADKYDDLVKKGYRWVTTDGPLQITNSQYLVIDGYDRRCTSTRGFRTSCRLLSAWFAAALVNS